MSAYTQAQLQALFMRVLVEAGLATDEATRIANALIDRYPALQIAGQSFIATLGAATRADVVLAILKHVGEDLVSAIATGKSEIGKDPSALA